MPSLNVDFKLYAEREGGFDGLGTSTVVVRGVNEARVKMTRKTASDEATFKVPAHRDLTFDFFRRDDMFTFWLGYLEVGLECLFKGPITEIIPGRPIEIRAESIGVGMFSNKYSAEYVDVGWKEIAADAIEHAGLNPQLSEFEPASTPRSPFRVDQHTPAQVLDTCAEAAVFTWYVLPGTAECYFGPEYQEPASEGPVYIFKWGVNILRDGYDIKYDLGPRVKKVVVTLADSSYLKPAATGSWQADDYVEGDRIKYVDDDDSDPTVEKAENVAFEHYKEALVSGVTGHFNAVGNPAIRQGSRILLINEQFTGPDGIHVTVDEVEHVKEGPRYTMVVGVAGGFNG